MTTSDQEWLDTYSPRLVFHPDEKYFPYNLEKLYHQGYKNSPDTLLYDNVCIKQNESVINEAPLYGKVDRIDGFIYIQYWIAYKFNGDQGCRLKGGLFAKKAYSFSWKPLANHYADFENVCLKVHEETRKIIALYASAHGSLSPLDGQTFDRVTYDDVTHPIIYSALNSHANYTTPFDVPNPDATLDSVMPILVPIITLGFYSSFSVCDRIQSEQNRNRKVWSGGPIIDVGKLNIQLPENAWYNIDIWGGSVDQTKITVPPKGTPFRFILYIVMWFAVLLGLTKNFIRSDEKGTISPFRRSEFINPTLYF